METERICFECNHYQSKGLEGHWCKKKKKWIHAIFNKTKCKSWEDWYITRTKKEEE